MTFLEKIDDAKILIKTAIELHPDIVLACSFGKDSMVLLHLVHQVNPSVPVFSVMAETEFPETKELSEKMKNTFTFYKEYIFQQDGGQCCGKPKVEATKKAVAHVSAWFSGIRSTEGITRANFKPVEELDGLVKVNPLLDFTETDIWRYTALYGLPINPKYKEGYRSLGCALCSTPELDETETERGGRWRGTPNACMECGIHTQSLRK